MILRDSGCDPGFVPAPTHKHRTLHEMSKCQLTSDPRTMDVRLQPNPQLHYAVNGGAVGSPRPGEDEALRFLSQEEQECIQFFEDTIVSLEASLKEEDRRPGQARSSAAPGAATEVDGPPTPSPTPTPSPGVAASSVVLSPKDQDIIDLVRPAPDLVQTKEPLFSPTNPDFQSMVPSPESHFEMKPRRDGAPSEYNPPLPSGGYGPADSHPSYHHPPPGCIPTPVLIAQKIAENQAGGGGGGGNLLPSSLLRRCSFESDRPPGCGADPAARQGPPTSAKPTRFPANISVILGGKEHQNQPLANVSIQERRAQMLANLTGTPPPQEDPPEQRARSVPTRSVSFRDPTPDKSRMEALSKLGLSRSRAMSGGTSLLLPAGAEAAAGAPGPATPPETPRTSPPRSQEERRPPPQRSPSPPSDYCPGVLPPPEVTSLEFNSYGGKSIVVNPSLSCRGDPPPPPLAPTDPGRAVTPVTPSRSDLPDILSSHIDKSHTLLPAPAPPAELNSSGGKSRPIKPPPSGAGPRRCSESPSGGFKPPAPTPAPRPPRHSYHGFVAPPPAQQQRAPSPGRKQRSGSMFRPQGITVQFSGRGATNESRREALRKLGLLKDS